MNLDRTATTAGRNIVSREFTFCVDDVFCLDIVKLVTEFSVVSHSAVYPKGAKVFLDSK